MPAVPAPPNPLMEVLRRLGMTLPLPQSPEESALAKSGGVAQSIRDIGGLFKGMVTGPKMSGPADAQDLGGALTMLLPLLGKIVYHGSPHLFKKFDMSKVGTGEGAQAYGHGLYFADKPEVAKGYSSAGLVGGVGVKTATGDVVTTAGRSATNATAKDYAVDALTRFNGDKWTAISWLNDYGIEKQARQWIKDNVKGATAELTKVGNLYDVDLPDDAIAKMLDWDAPLSQQAPDVQAALATQGFTDQRANMMAVYRGQIERAAGNPDRAARAWSIAEDMINDRRPVTGDFAHQHWQSLEQYAPGVNHDLIHDIRELSEPSGAEMYGMIGRPPDASSSLRQVGIPGIKYFDGVSRRAGDGTRNYVVFDDELPKIVNVQR